MMAEEERPDTLAKAVEKRAETQAALVKMLMQTDAQGQRALVIPPEMHKHYNVLAPTGVLTQQDPNFTPVITVATLAGDDYYDIDKNNKAPSKTGLRKLMDAIGIEFDGDKSGGTEFGDTINVEVGYGSTRRTVPVRAYKYKAVGKVRKSDGTKREITAETEWLPQMVLLNIEAEIDRIKWLAEKPEADKAAEVLKRFVNSATYRAPMLKSKAQNALIRDTGGLKQKYSHPEAAKPFFVVGYNLTLNPNDAATAGIIAALAGVGSAETALYGSTPALTAPENAPEIEPVDEDADVPFDVIEAEAPLDGEVVEEGGFSMDEQVPESPLSEDERGDLRALDAYVMPTTNKKGRHLKAIWDSKASGEGRDWFVEAKKYAEENTLNSDTADVMANVVQYLYLRDIAEGGER